ncbi:hybrid sensor histidine kinase/response regulator [Egbenema bharatensis]|uniref:hybrid sensor histidine kinase/response regulator n=1 Tax=Egbenema bharatensis TaxID=3463334 RepID=UPI003A8C5CC7
MKQASNQVITGNILIVDDTPANLRLLSAMLRHEGHEVRMAITGTAALRTIQVELPDLILLDINMPQINGYEICEQLKANEQTCEIPVIFLSAFDGVIDKVKAFQAGGADYVSKPFQVEEVLIRVRHQLELQHMKRNLQAAEARALQALDREKELSRLKSEFISILSHDFRTPLTHIRGFADLLRYTNDQDQNLSAVTQDRYFNKIDAAIEHLLNLLDKILFVSNHDPDAIFCQPVPTDLKLFCQNLIETLQPSLTHHTIRLICQSEAPESVVDPVLLQQILTNLLSNAVKYSPTTREIDLVLDWQEDWIQFQVHDRGIGIPASNLPHVFDMFYRCHNVGDIQGRGLGLAAAKKCVEIHQGEIFVDSEPGSGTTFTVRLPQSLPAAASQPPVD